MSASTEKHGWRLLPRESPLGWTPYAWLIYFPSFLIEPIDRLLSDDAHPLYLLVHALGTVLFLALYFRGHWVRGKRLQRIAYAITAMAVLFSFINPGACVLYVYAAAFAAQLERQRDAVRDVMLNMILASIVGSLIDPPLYYWITGVAVTLLVGAVNIHYWQNAAAQTKLRLAQDEIEHLAKVAERERIARDLHDVLGHTLSMIVLKSELAGRIAGTDPARASAEIRDVEVAARRVLQEVREAIRGYRATLPDEVERARAMLKAARIEAVINIPEMALPQLCEETLALSLREAITNVVRHSGAARCTITLGAERRAAVLLVADDGRGAGALEGAGLRGMRERVEALGGSVLRESQGGLRLRIAVPLAVESVRPEERVSEQEPVESLT